MTGWVLAERVIVGMSGGVDSSVAAMLLAARGDDVLGVFMRNWRDEDGEGECPALVDARDAMDVAEHLGIAFDVVDFTTEYRDRVFRYFLDEYAAGRTPNPDVLCNTEIKFRAFLDHALELGAERIVTGHYARIERTVDGHRLLKGRDPDKDQSYFLHGLDQRQLAHAEFPLGGLIKTEVRAMARRAALPTHAKKDSTGICFIGERHFRRFLSRYLPARPGEIRDLDGRLLGRHEGLMYYTIGQRQGLGIGGMRGRRDGPWYVAAKAMDENCLYVVQGRDHPMLQRRVLRAGSVHWIAGEPPTWPLECQARIRYRQVEQPCRVEPAGEEAVDVVFERPQWAPASGQSIVFYDDEVCLGGGVIVSEARLPMDGGPSREGVA